MRPVKLLIAIACCIPCLPAATAIETRKVQPVTIERILATPQSFQMVTVRFEATWIGVTNIFDSQRSHFHPERYINFSVWDARSELWSPDARAKPISSLYMGKDLPGADRPTLLSRYQAVEIEGKIVAIIDGQPWIEVTAIRPLERRGTFTDASIAQVEKGIHFADQGARDLADEHFAAALATDLPVTARIKVSAMRAFSLMQSSRWEEAAAVISGIAAAADADPLLPAEFRARAHAALARCLSEAAGDDPAKHAVAVAEAEKAVAIDPTMPEAYAVLGVSLTWLGRFDEALIQCDRAVRMRPDDAAVRLALGSILDRQGRHDEAVEALKRAIDLTPKDARVHRAIAQAYLNRAKKGNVADFPTALKETEIALRLSPQDANSHWVAGLILEAANAAGVELALPSGKAIPTIDQAKERYQAALTIDPSNVRAKASMQVFIDADAKAKADAEAAAKAKAEADAKAAADAAAKPVEEAKPAEEPKPEAAPAAEPAPAPAPAP